ncbi:MAG: hypothetical protein ACPIOQ_56210, partial [Promethearchaeia archaeon]
MCASAGGFFLVASFSLCFPVHGRCKPRREDGAQQLTQAWWRVEQGEQYYTFDVSVGEAPERSSRTRRVG